MEKAAQTKFILEHLDEMFPIVPASQLKLDDAFMWHEPVGWLQQRIMLTLQTCIPLGVHDFRHPAVDPSFDDEGNLIYEKGRMPGVGRLTIPEWKTAFKEYLPEKHSRMANDTEYDLFCAQLIKEMVESGCSIARSWYEVCNESYKLGTFWESRGREHMDPTGSRPHGKWHDLGNTRKIICNPSETVFYTASGAYKDSSQTYSIATRDEAIYLEYLAQFSVGLMVMDV